MPAGFVLLTTSKYNLRNPGICASVVKRPRAQLRREEKRRGQTTTLLKALTLLMQFQKGDKVRFLNETGEGIFVRNNGNGIAIVEVDDGFEYPFPLNQLVPVKSHERQARVELETPVQTEQAETSVPEVVNPGFPDGVYLVFQPQNQQIPSAGQIDVYVLNRSDYHIFFTVSLKDGKEWLCIQSGMLGPGRKAEVDTMTPADIDEWGQAKTDVLFYSDDHYAHINPLSNTIKLRGVKFMKDSSYQSHLLTDKKCYVAEIALIEDAAGHRDEKPFVSNDDLRRMMELKDRVSGAKKISVPHQKHQLLEKEIDLHIEELLENWSGMSNAQLLDVQLKRVQREMDEAIAAHMRKVIFIHGVGNGRLKTEVRKLLSSYSNVRIHDASFSRYGFGATEAEII